MKKLISLLILGFTVLASCERDDICIEPTTPNLVIRFYDAASTTETKRISHLYVWAVGLDSIYKDVTTDSIMLPLNVYTNTTIYKFATGTTEDQLTIQYTPEEIFVSRSCGYKTNFNNTTVTVNSNNWIQSIDVINPTVNNQNSAHVKIYH